MLLFIISIPAELFKKIAFRPQKIVFKYNSRHNKGNKNGDQEKRIIRLYLEKLRRAKGNDDDKLGKGKEMVDRLTNLVAIFENTKADGLEAEVSKHLEKMGFNYE